MALYGATSLQSEAALNGEAAELLYGDTKAIDLPEPAGASVELGAKTHLLVLVLVLLNTVLVGAIASIGWGMYRDMQAVVQPFLALTAGGSGAGLGTTRRSSGATGAKALVEQRLEDTLAAATTFFLFGDADSAVAAFVSNLLRFDFPSFGAAAQQFGAKLASTFRNVPCNQARVFCNTTSPNGNWQNPPLQCPPRPGYPNGNTVYRCEQYPASWGWAPPSFWINCGLGCPYAALTTIGGAISSVAAIVRRVALPASVQQVNVGPASFSTGVFRLDGLLQWVQSQFNLGAWAAAGTTCSTFFTQLQGQNWSNCFLNTASCGGSNSLSACATTTCWNINPGAIEFFNRSAEVCNVVAKLNQ